MEHFENLVRLPDMETQQKIGTQWVHESTLHVFCKLCTFLLHATREFYSIKLSSSNLYAIFSHLKKAYSANQNGVQLFFTCGRISNQRCKGLCKPIRIVHRLHSHNFSDLGAFFSGGASKAEESSRFVSVGCCSDEFVWHQENKNTSSKSQRDASLLKKKFSFEERAERD